MPQKPNFSRVKGEQSFLYLYIRKYSEKLDEQKKTHLKSNLCSRVMGFSIFIDDVTGAKKTFYHADPYIID